MGRPAKPDGERVRDIAPTGVRLEPGLRDALSREATINGRSLNAEILVRLRESLQPGTRASSAPASTQEPAAVYTLSTGLSDSQRQLVTLFDAMAPDRQLALLTLLRR